MTLKYINYYFLFLFSIFPISLVLGSTVSLLNIILIDLSFIILIIYLRDFSFLKSRVFKYLIILYLYLIFNSLISVDKTIGIYRNIGFVRIIILFVAINYFFKDKEFLKKVFYFWLFIILIVSFDVILESVSGKNILGYGSLYGKRIVSFFKDEPIVGGYIYAFYLLIIGFLSDKFNFKNKILILALFFLLCIFITGERSNSIKALIGIVTFYTFFREYKPIHKLILSIGCLVLIMLIIFNSSFLKQRYIGQISSLMTSNQIYFDLYKSGFKMFNHKPIFGVGNKNYRVLSCSEEEFLKNSNDRLYQCNSHPHQIYFELLSEHGVIGTILILFLIYKLVLSKLLFNLRTINYIQLGSGIYLSLIFLPLIPSGALFSDYLMTIFGINLSIFYASNPNYNIFLAKKR